MKKENGVRSPIVFPSISASYEAFKDLWTRKYGGFPTLDQASMYTGKDNAQTWLSNVNYYYYLK